VCELIIGNGSQSVIGSVTIGASADGVWGVVGVEPWGFAPIGTEVGDAVYGEKVSGDGVFGITRVNFSSLIAVSQVFFITYSYEQEKWLDLVEVAVNWPDFASVVATNNYVLFASDLLQSTILDSVVGQQLYTMQLSTTGGSFLGDSVVCNCSYQMYAGEISGHKSNYERWATRPAVSGDWTVRTPI
jgi:hypothetical protein